MAHLLERFILYIILPEQCNNWNINLTAKESLYNSIERLKIGIQRVVNVNWIFG
jgi:hypothetical protein